MLLGGSWRTIGGQGGFCRFCDADVLVDVDI
jgi:hypothetical protein